MSAPTPRAMAHDCETTRQSWSTSRAHPLQRRRWGWPEGIARTPLRFGLAARRGPA